MTSQSFSNDITPRRVIRVENDFEWKWNCILSCGRHKQPNKLWCFPTSRINHKCTHKNYCYAMCTLHTWLTSSLSISSTSKGRQSCLTFFPSSSAVASCEQKHMSWVHLNRCFFLLQSKRGFIARLKYKILDIRRDVLIRMVCEGELWRKYQH